MRSTSSAAIGFPHSGWPIGPDEIRTYLGEARALLGVGGVDVARLPRPQLLQRLSSEELAVRWWSFDPVFDRFTIDRAEDLQDDPRCTLMIHATVREVMLADDKGSIERLDVRTPSGRKIDVRARHYLLAAGGIENPRILLASNSVAASAGSAMPTTWSAAISWSIRMPAAGGSSARPNGAGFRPSPSGGSMESRSRRRSRRRSRCSGAKACSTSALTDRSPAAGRRQPSAGQARLSARQASHRTDPHRTLDVEGDQAAGSRLHRPHRAAPSLDDEAAELGSTSRWSSAPSRRPIRTAGLC